METVKIILEALGGLAIFIFGMNMMSEGMQKSAGAKLRKIIGHATNNTLFGIMTGCIVTMTIQSSSATLVMVIGFVTAGLMTFRQAINVTLGANIGTTITAQIVAFKVGDYAWFFVFIGFIIYMIIKKSKIKSIGETIFGFGILFVGLNTMGNAMAPIAHNPSVTDLILKIADSSPLGILFGTGITAIIQSSSASIATLQNLASTAAADGVTPLISLQGAIPIVLGANIGTTITAVLASVGGGKNAKKVAFISVVINAVGIICMAGFIPQIAQLATFISPAGNAISTISRQIANAHLIFNVIAILIFIPFVGIISRNIDKIFKDDKIRKIDDATPQFLTTTVLDRPFMAIPLVQNEIVRLAEITKKMIVYARDAVIKHDEKAIEEILQTEKSVNILHKKIVAYLSELFATETLADVEGKQVTGLLHMVADIEHIGDHCKSIGECAQEMVENDYEFSDIAYAELHESFGRVRLMLKDAMQAVKTGDVELANVIIEEGETLEKMESRLRKQHLQRVNTKTCDPSYTALYNDIVHDIRKIGEYCYNLAIAYVKDVSERSE